MSETHNALVVDHALELRSMEKYTAVLADLPTSHALHPGMKVCQPSKQRTITREDAWWGQRDQGTRCEEGTYMTGMEAYSCNLNSQGIETKF